MADINVEKLIVEIEARTKQFENQLKKVEGNVQASSRRMSKNFNEFNSTIKGVGATLLKSFGAGAVLAGLSQLPDTLRNMVGEVAKIGDLADKIGLTTDQLQDLNYGAVQANMSFEDLSTGLIKFSKGIAEASTGGGELYKILQANGINAESAAFKQMSLNDKLRVFADLIKNAQNEQDRLYITLSAFGKGGDGFAEFLRNGADGLDKVAAASVKAGNRMSEELIKSMQEIDDRWAAMTLSMGNKFKSMTLTVIDIFKEFFHSSGTIMSRADVIMGARDRLNLLDGNQPHEGGTRNLAPVTRLPVEPSDAEKQAIADAKRKADAIRSVVESLQFEQEQLGRTDLQQQIYNELKKAGVSITSQQGQQIAALVTNIETETKAKEEAIKQTQAWNDAMWMLGDAFEQTIEGIISGTASAKDALKGLIDMLLKAMLQATLLGSGPLAGMFGTAGANGAVGGLFGAMFGHALGGPTVPNQPYVVGEQGPELFVPSVSGSIVPNNKLGGSTSNVTVLMNNDFRGADGSAVARIEAQMQTMSRTLEKNVLSIVQNQKNKNPRFAA